MKNALIPKRLIPSLRKRWHGLGNPQRYRLVKREGIVFLVDYSAWADKMAVIHGLAERPQTEFLLGLIRVYGTRTFIDIGAHMGTYAMIVRRHTECERVIAFEPDPRNFAHLGANLLVNGMFETIEAHKLAVSNKEGVAGFQRGEPPNDVWSKMADWNESGAMFVQTVRLDNRLTLKGESIAIKIDIEGHEAQAIAGMSDLIRDNDCVLQVECFEPRLLAFEKQMADLGYRRFHTIAHDHYFSRM